jgi:hypothetical protein
MPMSTEPAESRPTTNHRGAADRQRLYWQAGLALVVVGILVFNAWSEARKARVQEEEAIAVAEHKAAEKARKAEEKADAARRKAEAGTKSRSTPAKADAPKSNASKGKELPHGEDVATASPSKPADDLAVDEPPPKPRDKPAGSEAATKPSEPRGPPATGGAKPAPKSSGTPKTKADPPTLFRNVTLKNQDGRVIYRGDIDVAPTLARIDRGDVLSQYRNDGITFQNREGRLPKKPSGHYREWVHPTPGVGGPGPQRIVTGKSGEAYYTHDHYDTFRKIR